MYIDLKTLEDIFGKRRGSSKTAMNRSSETPIVLDCCTVNGAGCASQPSSIQEALGRMATATRPAFKKMRKEAFRLVPSRMPSGTSATITSTTNHSYVSPPMVPSGEFVLLPDQPNN